MYQKDIIHPLTRVSGFMGREPQKLVHTVGGETEVPHLVTVPWFASLKDHLERKEEGKLWTVLKWSMTAREGPKNTGVIGNRRNRAEGGVCQRNRGVGTEVNIKVVTRSRKGRGNRRTVRNIRLDIKAGPKPVLTERKAGTLPVNRQYLCYYC